MIKLKIRKGSWIIILVAMFAWFATPASQIKAESYEVSEAKDFYFYWTEEVQLEFRTFAQQYGIDSMLWLYNEKTNNLVASNDDYFGLDSYITYLIQPNTIYRLRAGVCCGDPHRWYGTSYFLEVSNYIYNPTTTTEQAVITIEETTTTTELVTTTTELATTTTELSTTIEVITTEPEIVETTTTETSTTEVFTTEVSTTIPIQNTIEKMTTTTSSATTTTQVVNTTSSTNTTVDATTTTNTFVNTTIDNKIDNKDIINFLSKDLSNASDEEVKEIFSSIDISSLTPEEEQELIKNLNSQNDDIKKLFESEIDVFGNGLDEYVPSGSLIDVGTRRVLIAATTVVSTIGVSTGTATSSKRR